MKSSVKTIAGGALAAALLMPVAAGAADQDLQKRVDDLSKQLTDLKRQVNFNEKKSIGRWLTISGDYRFRYDYLHGQSPSFYPFMPAFAPPTVPGGPGTAATYIGIPPYGQPFGPGGPNIGGPAPASNVRNNALFTNRFGLNFNGKPIENITFGARLLMYKAWGDQSDRVLQSQNGTAYSFDRAGLFDGTLGHLPGSSLLNVDRIYVDWENIGGEPIWFSVGRRPSTDGIPIHLKTDQKQPGVGGIPALLVNYAFDGLTLGYAPDIDALPGAYAKFCYGRGFSTGLSDSRETNSLKDTDMFGLQVVPYNTDALQVLLQYNRAVNIFDAPQMLSGPFGQVLTGPKTNLGDMDWYGINLLGAVKNVGPGTLNWFVQGAVDVSHPNGNTLKLDNPYDGGQTSIDTGAGLLFSGSSNSTTGWAAFAGVRYDYNPTRTKVGFEYNHGSKNWMTFAPAEDDMWTSKVGTRGNVYEAYVIQELPLKPISSYFSKAFFRLGYQFYDFDYTGSNSWLGAPVKMSELTASPMNAQMTAPLTTAQDLYATFEVNF